MRVEEEITTRLVGLHGDLHVSQRGRTMFSRCLVHHSEWLREAREKQGVSGTTWWMEVSRSSHALLIRAPHTRLPPTRIGEFAFILPPDDDSVFARQSDLRVSALVRKDDFTPWLISLLPPLNSSRPSFSGHTALTGADFVP